MNTLFQKIQAGKFERVPKHYSNDIWSIVSAML